MLKNYFTIAIRNLMRHKLYSVINIIGLSIGLAFCILTFLFVREEWTYDAFHTKANRIYRIYAKRWSEHPSGAVPGPLGQAFAEAFPELQVIRFHKASGAIQYGEKSFNERICFTDPSVFDVFTFPLLQGDPATALRGKHTIVIAEEMAEKYFGNEDPMGKPISIEYNKHVQEFTVTGVAKTIPRTSTLRFNFLLPFENISQSLNAWNMISGTSVYVLLPAQVKASEIEHQFPDLVATWWKDKPEYRLGLQPLTDIHLNPHIRGPDPGSNPMYSYILSSIALLVLCIACINFTTLATGRLSTRVREVGLRKVVGATRIQVMKQFFGESVLLSLMALVFAIALVELLLPPFNGLTGKTLALADHANAVTGAFVIGLILCVGLSAGAYPALVMSGFQPVEALKGRFKMGGSNLFSRCLVIFQFALSIVLIIGALVFAWQLAFLRTKPLGIHTDHVVIIQVSDIKSMELRKTYRDALHAHHAVIKTSATSHPLSNMGSNRGDVQWEDIALKNVEMIYVDPDFLETLQASLAEGRNFSDAFATDSQNAAIINETLAKNLGWNTAVDKTLRIGKQDFTIIGMVKDFHFRSLHHEIQPAILRRFSDQWLWRLLVRIRPEDVPGTLAFMEATWKKVAPDLTFYVSFLDDELNRQYREEERWNSIIRYAALFAIFIASLGAFGLTSLAVARRTKEIGIRKVLGASASGIVLMLSKDFVKLVLIANLIAWPVAYYAMNRWLENFAYRINLGWEIFVLSGGLALLIALLTVSGQAWKAARANPVDALRNE